MHLQLFSTNQCSTTLLDSLKSSFGEPELLSVAEGNGWRPEKGADKVDAHKGCTLIAKGLPPILQFHLKRFNYDWQTDTMTKLNNRFSFPDELNLSSVCKTVDPGEKELVVYDLQSVVIHMGEYGVGHYYSYIRPDIQSNTWYRFNDDIVEEVPFQEVMDDAFGGKSSASSPKKNKQQGGLFRRLTRILQGGPGNIYGWGGRTSNAYVVQYVRRCDRPMLYPE
jgi:ubiquitin carboxyl-terminal hydrolase 7